MQGAVHQKKLYLLPFLHQILKHGFLYMLRVPLHAGAQRYWQKYRPFVKTW